MGVPLIEARNVKKYFKTPAGILHAVDDVSFQIQPGETLGVVGESGCGKSTLGRTILRLLEATDGEVLYDGENILNYSKQDMKKVHRNMQMIFQDPFTSLNPRLSISSIIAEPIKVCGLLKSNREIQERVGELMDMCGLPNRYVNTYPHELDGGRRQRVGLARALAVDPKFIVCDEPVSALDVSIQAQILNLLMDLQDQKKLSYMFITHDLCVVRHISDKIMVMYMGTVVEYATKEEMFRYQAHPYTKALLSAIPIADLSHRNRERHVLSGEVANPINPAPGCRFAPRCPHACERCKEPQKLREIAPGHYVACVMC
ncbi:MAG: ABC transporter ATP-binding protein [Eubacteriales bacterium]|nr:ABC transporter ATP-binding protein [Eubacteriales bacterium]